jgi:hypothetical protein
VEPVIRLEEIVMILDLHRQGANVSAIARRAWQELFAFPMSRGILCCRRKKRRKAVIRAFAIVAASAAVLALSTTAFAQQTGGTGDEAKAMLIKAVAAVKADKAKALDMFNKGEGGFLDRDVYVFCGNVSDGKAVATGNPNRKQTLGVDVRTLKDSTGKPYGAEIYAAYQKPEGEITEVSYMLPRPGANKTPVPKVSFVTRAGDLGCGVGYYK